jgi:hypothetical protein
VTALDLYPTLAGLAGASIPQGKQFDGKDIWRDLLAGRDPRRNEMVYALRHRDGYSDVGARQDQWKIARVGQQPWQLFDIAKDMGETHDVSAQHPERLKEMVSRAEEWSRSHTEPKWFHELKARDSWKQAEMPNFEVTFRLERREAADEVVSSKSGRAKGDSTKSEFIAAQKARHEQRGWPFDRSKIEKQFDAIDANGDGIASGKEKKAYWAKVMEDK